MVDSCHSNHNDELCPVLLKLGKKYDARLEKTESPGDPQDMASEQEDPAEEQADRYLLQVWHKSGIMIYERHMHAKPKSWNLFNNVFLFKEMGNDAVYLLRYKEHHMPELFKIMMDVVIVNN